MLAGNIIRKQNTPYYGRHNRKVFQKGGVLMNPCGYTTRYGYRGYVESYHKWMLFASEEEYLEFISD